MMRFKGIVSKRRDDARPHVVLETTKVPKSEVKNRNNLDPCPTQSHP